MGNNGMGGLMANDAKISHGTGAQQSDPGSTPGASTGVSKTDGPGHESLVRPLASDATPCEARCWECERCEAAGRRFQLAARRLRELLDDLARSETAREASLLDAIDDSLIEVRRAMARPRDWNLDGDAQCKASILAQPEPVLCGSCKFDAAAVCGLCAHCSTSLDFVIEEADHHHYMQATSWHRGTIEEPDDWAVCRSLRDALEGVRDSHPADYRIVAEDTGRAPVVVWQGRPEETDEVLGELDALEAE